MEMKGQKIKKNLCEHFVSSTALLVESTPIFAFIETFIAGVSDTNSLITRSITGGFIYFGGGGWIYNKGRELYQNIFANYSKYPWLHDGIYTGLFNVFLFPIFHPFLLLEDPKHLVAGTISSAVIGAINGIPMGYFVDVFKDLFGLKECNRKYYPGIVKYSGPKIKKSLAFLTMISSLLLTEGVYNLIPD